MEGRTVMSAGQIRGSSNTSLSGLIAFCIDSATACLSPDADKLCVPVDLSALSALLLLLSCLVLMYQRCRYCGEQPGEAAICLYCLLGNLCSTVGALLSRQLALQVVMSAFAAAVDVVNFISILLPLCLCWNSKAERMRRVMRRRRRQHLLAVCVLIVLGRGLLTLRVDHSPSDGPLTGRRLLHAPLQDNIEVLGYTLGLLSFVIACTSKFPALSRARRGEMVTSSPVMCGVLCFAAGVLYASAILLYSTQFDFVLRVLPWLLSAICCATLELLILVTYWCRRGSRQHPSRLSPDTESLLCKHSPAMKRETQQLRNTKKMIEMGHYMDVNVQRARKVCLKEVTVTREGALENQPLKRTVRVVRVDGISSDSSCDSSSVTSDLEWDFEEANAEWSEASAKQEKGDEFPLQEWPENPKPFGICSSGMSQLPGEMTVPGEVGSCGSVTDMAQ
ncbi:transmembrane protein 44 isoform X2 [Myripristis murdjan]|uniref:transmembrane protein 44 isoform X2 n=1 Tax=Myripristis murdjan TaxID=586833 RepID=UPI0011762DB1|nr:transmembrane protein 44 isoform X2 [Myripristis murdjan]